MMDQTKIWDYFQNDANVNVIFENARRRYEFIERRIAPGMKVLNIGVGRGGLEANLIKKGALVYSLDPSEGAIDKLRTLYSLGDRAKVGFSHSIPFPDNQFDVVILTEVLEHLPDDQLQATVLDVSRVLKSSGRFIGTVPADENLLSNHVMCPHCGVPFHRWGHQQTFSDKRLLSLLLNHFDNILISRHYFADIRTLNWKGRFVCLLKKIFVAFGIRGDEETYFFSATKS